MTRQEKIIPDPPEISDIEAAKTLFEHCMARAVHYPTLRPAYISAAVNAAMTLIPLELDYDRFDLHDQKHLENPERNAGYQIMTNLTPPQLQEAMKAEFRRWIETRTDEYRELLVRGKQEADQELAEYLERHKELRARIEREKQRTQ